MFLEKVDQRPCKRLHARRALVVFILQTTLMGAVSSVFALPALAQQSSGQSAAGQSISGQPVIAAASDLKFALEEIAQQYRTDTGATVKLIFGSSGNLSTQIMQGAPFDVFMSADEALVERLYRAQLTVDAGVLYGIGRLVLYAGPGSKVKVDPEFNGVRVALGDGSLKRLAIANPEHAPYGQRAVQALKSSGLWEAVQPKLVFGENVSQAASFASLGNAQAAIIALSLVSAPPLSQQGSFAVLPETLHQPLRQSMVLLKRSDEPGKAFYTYLRGDKARAVFSRFGFSGQR